MNRLAIIGAGDLGQLIAHHAATDSHKEIIGFFDDFLPINTPVGKSKVLGRIATVYQFYESGFFDCLMLGIGYKHFAFRQQLFEQFKDKIPFANIIHRSAFVDSSCQLGSGIFVLPSCSLDYNVKIADNVLLNTACTLAHDTSIGRHSFLSPRVAVAGFVKIGSCCNIGINSTIIDNITIADHIQTGGATLVIKNLTKAGLYVGSPARFVR